MSKYTELIGELVEYRTEEYQMTTGKCEPNPVALGLIAEDTGDNFIRIEWLVNAHNYTIFNTKEINKFGLALKDNKDWRA